MMVKSFSEALDAGFIQRVILWNGDPFVVNGVQYYEATGDGANMLIGRYHALGDTINRHDSLKVSEEVQRSYLESIEILNNRIVAQLQTDPQQALDAAVDIKALTDRMKMRMALGVSIELLYNVASISFFTENEDPGVSDSEANKTKIRDWLAWENCAGLYAFFLARPWYAFEPSSNFSSGSTLKSIHQLNELELLDLMKLSSTLKTIGLKTGLMNTFESRKAILSGLNGLLEQLLSDTMNTTRHS